MLTLYVFVWFECAGVCVSWIYIVVICTRDVCVCVRVCEREVQVPVVLTGLLHVLATLDKPRLGLIL